LGHTKSSLLKISAGCFLYQAHPFVYSTLEIASSWHYVVFVIHSAFLST